MATTSSSSEASKPQIIKLKDFFVYSNILHLTIGMKAYATETQLTKWRSMLLHASFISQLIILNIVLLGQILFVIVAINNGSNFVEATLNIAIFSFGIVGNVKIAYIYMQHAHISSVVDCLQELHPQTLELQVEYRVEHYLRSFTGMCKFYCGMHLILAWTYNLYWAVYYLIMDLWLGKVSYVRMLPYYSWTPWDYQHNWSYYPTYIAQNLAAQYCFAGQLATDMLLLALATLMVMHFERLGLRLEQHVAGVCAKRDIRFLQSCIAYHQRLLLLCEDINKIFGISLLCNFGSSCGIICFVIFQLTVGGQLDTLLMLLLFLICAMVQIILIGNHAQRLINASEQIGQAIYNHDWFNANLQYRKLMLQIMIRSQSACYLKATPFLPISHITVASVSMYN
ncbi:Or85d [Drosophila busckii]|uniref:Odorant receptor n=1 Tax=Drosophila busckii TaxID=30019 RepID=A0A0M4EQN1_DROBS|nr:Or85d [Drosophila busckii]